VTDTDINKYIAIIECFNYPDEYSLKDINSSHDQREFIHTQRVELVKGVQYVIVSKLFCTKLNQRTSELTKCTRTFSKTSI